ncbi:hypothetical protein MKEN_00443200 [Mycena kentingensis (nom. inval.)]|nr:hypothetical protein MKEN_00443200 [Mycena kentingensis (nom. inval.)]
MLSDPNRHDRPPGTPPPPLGTTRSRPNDSTNSSESDTSPTAAVTRSPHTRRVVKRGRTDAPVPPPRFDPTPATHSDQPATVHASAGTAGDLARCAPTERADDIAPLVRALETLLSRAVATTAAIQLDGEPAPSYPEPIQQLVRSLHSRVCSTTLTPPTFANVAATPVTPADPHDGSARQPTAPRPAGGLETEPTSAPARSAPQPTRKTPHKRPQRSSYRAIVRWPHPPAVDDRMSCEDIVRKLNFAFQHVSLPYCPIRAVAWTRHGNLAVYSRAPYTAAQLARHADLVIDVVDDIWRWEENGRVLDSGAVFELDEPWARVVVHGVPGEGYANGPGMLWEELDRQGYDRESVLAAPMLKPGVDPSTRESISVKLTFKDVAAAERLLTQRTLFLYDTACRVSRYRR